MEYTVYLANKMTGIEGFNFPWFIAAAAYLREACGFTVLSPAEKDLEEVPLDLFLNNEYGDIHQLVEESVSNGTPWTLTSAMEWDLPAIKASDGIVLGPDWVDSTGGRWERVVAEALDRDIWLLYGNTPEDFNLLQDPTPKAMTEFMKGFPEWCRTAA